MELFNSVFEGVVYGDEKRALGALYLSLKDIYRFKGSKHEISTPNSVYDHAEGLVRLIGEVFKDLPIHLSEYKVKLLRMAYLHDMGEVFGELSVLDNVLDTKTKGIANKSELEYIFFCEAIRSFISLPNFSNLIHEDRRMLSNIIYGNYEFGSKVKDFKSYNLEVSSELLYWYCISANYNTPVPHYLNKTFKMLDLIEGCQYYIANAQNPEYVPSEHIDRYQKHYTDELGALIAEPNYTFEVGTIKLKVIAIAIKTYRDYLELMGL